MFDHLSIAPPVRSATLPVPATSFQVSSSQFGNLSNNKAWPNLSANKIESAGQPRSSMLSVQSKMPGRTSTPTAYPPYSRFTSYLDTMKKTEDSLCRYKMGKISSFSLFGGSSRENEEGKSCQHTRPSLYTSRPQLSTLSTESLALSCGSTPAAGGCRTSKGSR